MKKEVREIVEAAEAQGWRVRVQANGHVTMFAPDGVGIVRIAGTPSDWRWQRNTIAKMRQHGFVWPPKR